MCLLLLLSDKKITETDLENILQLRRAGDLKGEIRRLLKIILSRESCAELSRFDAPTNTERRHY